MLEGVTKDHTVSTNTFSAHPKTFSLCLQLPQEEWILCWKSIFCKQASLEGKWEPEACAGRMWVLPYAAHSADRSSGTAGWSLAVTHCFVSSETIQETDFQVCPCSWSQSFACYPAESETSAACRESSLFTEEICSCAHPRSISGHLWEYRDN